MKDNLSPEEYEYLKNTFQQSKNWMNKHAPDNVSESFNLMFKLVQHQRKAMNEYNKIVKNQRIVMTDQKNLLAESNKQVEQMLENYSKTNKLENIKNELLEEMIKLKDEVLKNEKNNKKSDQKT